MKQVVIENPIINSPFAESERHFRFTDEGSRPFYKPESGKIAVKVINHYGDEVLKVFEVKG